MYLNVAFKVLDICHKQDVFGIGEFFRNLENFEVGNGLPYIQVTALWVAQCSIQTIACTVSLGQESFMMTSLSREPPEGSRLA